MTAGEVVGIDGIGDSSFGRAASGLWLLGENSAAISGGVIRGGDAARGSSSGVAIRLTGLSVNPPPYDGLIIDGGEFFGGTGDPDANTSGGSAISGFGWSGRFVIGGGYFQAGEDYRNSSFGVPALNLNASNAPPGTAVLDINGGVFRKGALRQPPLGFSLDYSIATLGDYTVNLRGGDLEDIGMNAGVLNVYGDSFVLDAVPVDFTSGTTQTFTAADGGTFDGGLEVDFLLGGAESFDFHAATLNLIRPSGVAGDLNNDGIVSQADLDLVLLNWGAGVAPEGWVEQTTFDRLVSQNELDAVLLNWGNGTPPSLAIPEPTTAAFVALGGLMALRRRA